MVFSIQQEFKCAICKFFLYKKASSSFDEKEASEAFLIVNLVIAGYCPAEASALSVR